MDWKDNGKCILMEVPSYVVRIIESDYWIVLEWKPDFYKCKNVKTGEVKELAEVYVNSTSYNKALRWAGSEQHMNRL